MHPELSHFWPRDPVNAPVVLAIEGLCFAGKTTLARALAMRLGATVVPEYANLVNLPPWPPDSREDVAAALRLFLRVEQQRAILARRAPSRLVVLDRSPLTLITHEFGMARLGVPAASDLAAHMFADAAERRLILTPDSYIYLRVPASVRAARQVRRGPIPVHLTDPLVQAGIEAAIHAYLDLVPPRHRLVLDGTACVDELVDAVTQLVANIPPPAEQAVPNWRVLTSPAQVSQTEERSA